MAPSGSGISRVTISDNLSELEVVVKDIPNNRQHINKDSHNPIIIKSASILMI